MQDTSLLSSFMDFCSASNLSSIFPICRKKLERFERVFILGSGERGFFTVTKKKKERLKDDGYALDAHTFSNK